MKYLFILVTCYQIVSQFNCGIIMLLSFFSLPKIKCVFFCKKYTLKNSNIFLNLTNYICLVYLMYFKTVMHSLNKHWCILMSARWSLYLWLINNINSYYNTLKIKKLKNYVDTTLNLSKSHRLWNDRDVMKMYK